MAYEPSKEGKMKINNRSNQGGLYETTKPKQRRADL